MRVEIELEEGDAVEMNGRWWKVKEIERDPFEDLMTLSCETGDTKIVTGEELQEMIDFSGGIKIIRKDYRGIID